MKSCELRVSRPEVAKVSVPRTLLCSTWSSRMKRSLHTFETPGSPLRPNWAMKRGTTRKKRVSS